MARKSIKAPAYQVFLGHATADKWLARVICQKIEEAGATIFIDERDIDGGDDIPDGIRRQIKRSRELVVLLTPTSVSRVWVILEVGAAWGWSKKIRIVPMLCHVDTDPLPGILKAKKAIPLNDVDQYLGELKRRVGRQSDAQKE